MTTTWESMVGFEEPPKGRERACVLCGGCYLGKLMYVEEFIRDHPNQHKLPIYEVTLNICRSAILFYDSKKETPTIHICTPCCNWITKRSTKQICLSPYDTLQIFFKTLTTDRKKTLDLRIIKRLCSTLNSKHLNKTNYFLQFLSSAEKCLVEQITQTTDLNIVNLIAEYNYEMNAKSIFCNSKIASERIRDFISDRPCEEGDIM